MYVLLLLALLSKPFFCVAQCKSGILLSSLSHFVFLLHTFCFFFQKYSKLIVPWLTLAILSAVVFACCNIYDVIYRNHQWDDIMFVVVMIGLYWNCISKFILKQFFFFHTGIPIIIIHPMYVMYADIRKETMEAAEYDGEYQSNEKNNFGDYFVRTIY